MRQGNLFDQPKTKKDNPATACAEQQNWDETVLVSDLAMMIADIVDQYRKDYPQLTWRLALEAMIESLTIREGEPDFDLFLTGFHLPDQHAHAIAWVDPGFEVEVEFKAKNWTEARIRDQ